MIKLFTRYNNLHTLKLFLARKLTSSIQLCRQSFDINTHEEFQNQVMHSNFPVVVNFHADWCDPCKILTPKLKQLIEPIMNVDLAIVDVEKNPELVESFEVKAVPAVIAINNGSVVDKFIGLVDEKMIEELVEKLRLNYQKIEATNEK